jgi:hypothetical protein
MKLKTEKTNVVEVSDWDKLVKDTYKRPYSLQQQDGCMDRGHVTFTVPSIEDAEEFDSYMHDEIPEKVNGNEMGVKFAVWLQRDPKMLSGEIKSRWENNLFWERNFYPNLSTVANDLYNKGLLEAGEYLIDIDW